MFWRWTSLPNILARKLILYRTTLVYIDMYRKQRGVTLIELMIVVAIIGIIAAVAYPAYQDQARKTRRAEGTSELTRIMDLQERFSANNFPPSYSASLVNLGYAGATHTTENGHYIISAAACAGATIAQCVILTAAAQPSQAGDGNLTLDSRGARTRDGNAGWD